MASLKFTIWGVSQWAEYHHTPTHLRPSIEDFTTMLTKLYRLKLAEEEKRIVMKRRKSIQRYGGLTKVGRYVFF